MDPQLLDQRVRVRAPAGPFALISLMSSSFGGPCAVDEGLLKCLKVIIIYVIPKWRKDTKISWAELEVEGRMSKKNYDSV